MDLQLYNQFYSKSDGVDDYIHSQLARGSDSRVISGRIPRQFCFHAYLVTESGRHYVCHDPRRHFVHVLPPEKGILEEAEGAGGRGEKEQEEIFDHSDKQRFGKLRKVIR